jgi:hypothetical protein
MQVERRTRRIEDSAPLDDGEIGVHAETEPLERCRQVTGMDQRPVHRRLAAHRVEPRSVEKGLAQRVTCQRLIQARDGRSSLGERRGGRRRVPRAEP